MNHLQCMIGNWFTSYWILIQSVYYFMKMFDSEQTLADLLVAWYPYVCTCNEDADIVMAFMGLDADAKESIKYE